MNLPTEVVEGNTTKVSKLVIASHQGTGKSTLVSALPKNLIIDLEKGSDQISAIKIDVKGEAAKANVPEGKIFMDIISAIKEANAKNGDYVYDYLTIDTLTALESLSKLKALKTFNNSVIGKGMRKKGELVNDVVTDLPSGGGYQWLFRGFNELYDALQGLVRVAIIFLGHTKQGSLLKKGADLSTKDLQLTGKLKTDLLRDVDAAGYLYRKDPNTVNISFISDERDLTTKARAKQLRNQDFTISSLNEETGELTCFWNKVFVDEIKEPIVIKI